MFSLGVILFRLIFKEYPFTPNAHEDKNSRDPHFVTKFINSQDKNKNRVRISSELESLLQSMLEFRPEKRSSIDDILSSPWFKL